MRARLSSRSIAWVLWIGCHANGVTTGGDDPSPKDTANAVPSPVERIEDKLDPEAWCKLVLHRPSPDVATCAGRERGPEVTSYLNDLIDSRVASCVQMLGPDARLGRIKLVKSKECAKALAAQSWKDILMHRTIATHKACQGAMVGSQEQGAECQSDAACKEGLYCKGGGPNDVGVCVARASQDEACEGRPSNVYMHWITRNTCKAGLRCTGSSTERRFPLGYDAGEPLPQRAFFERTAEQVRQTGQGLIAAGPGFGGVEPRGIDRILRHLSPDDGDPATSPGPWGDLTDAKKVAPLSPSICVPTEPCEHNSECDTYQVCVAGACRDELAGEREPCSASIDCGAGLYCKFTRTRLGQCVQREPKGVFCRTSLSCQGICSENNTCTEPCLEATAQHPKR